MVFAVVTRGSGRAALNRSTILRQCFEQQQQRNLSYAFTKRPLSNSNRLTIQMQSKRPALIPTLTCSTVSVGLGAQRNISIWPLGSANKSETSPTEVLTDVTNSKADELTPQETTLTAATSPSDPLAAVDLSQQADSAQEAISHATEQVQTLADLGQLSGWINVRAAQSVLDWLVEATGIPWWLTIAAVTLSVRVLVLPLVLRGQKNAIRLANIQPQMNSYMKDISYAKQTGDQQLMSRAATSVQQLMKENDCHPLRSFIVPAVQAPLFMTFFFALRGLAEAGLPAMKTGGLSWFTDLTMADPYYILPVLSSLSMLAVLETGAEMGTAGNNATPQANMMRWVFRVLTVVAIPFIIHFPAAVFCYWLTNGCISLLQLLVLNLSGVRRVLNLPERIQHTEELQNRKGEKPLGFWDSVAAGSSSQQKHTVQVIRKNRNTAPSVLQEQKGIEESRERALKKLSGKSNKN